MRFQVAGTWEMEYSLCSFHQKGTKDLVRIVLTVLFGVVHLRVDSEK